MRSRGPSKQRLWLGSGRYPCCGGRRHTDADAHCYSDSDPTPTASPTATATAHAATDANTEGGAISKAAPHASAQALDFSLQEIRMSVTGTLPVVG